MNLCAFQKLGNITALQDTLEDLAIIATFRGDFAAAKKYYDEIENNSEKLADQQWEVVYNHLHHGVFAFVTNDLEAAYGHFMNALAGIKDNRGDIFAGDTLARLGFILLYQGRLDEARQYFEQGFVAMQKVAQESDAAFIWYGLGEMERMAGNVTVAIEKYQRSIFLRDKFQMRIFIPDLLDGFAKLTFLQNDLVGAVRWFGCADGLRRKFGSVMYPIYHPDYDKHLELLKSKMSAADFESAWAVGAKTELHETVALALQGFEPEKP